MPDVRDLLDRESRTVELAPGDFDRLLGRRERKARQRQLAAGAFALVVVLLTAAVLLRSFVTTVPATPTPGPPGALAYFAFGDLFVAEWDGSNPVRIADGEPATDDGCADGYTDAGPIWSPDGRYLVAKHSVCDGDVFVRDEGVIFDLDGEVVGSFPMQGWLLPWSPDSTRIVNWTEWGETLAVYGLDGELQQELPLPEGLMAPGDYDPAWSADGRSLLVKYGGVVPLDGSTPYQLPSDDPRSQRDATFSPDGTRVAYVDGTALMVAAADGSDPRSLVDAWAMDPIWSPSGDRIAFAWTSDLDEGLPTEVRVVDVATGRVTRPIGMSGSGWFWPVEFTPDGEQILVARTMGNDLLEPAMWIMNADGSAARPLVDAMAGDWQPATGS